MNQICKQISDSSQVDFFLDIKEHPTVVRKQRKSPNNQLKSGIEGILDPFASGALLIGIGCAPKFFNYLPNTTKSYTATIVLGQETDTLDTTGVITKSLPVPILSKEIIENTLHKFIGKSTQVPPLYSNLKVEGQRARDLVRKGKEVLLKSREIDIFSMQLESYTHNSVTFSCHVDRGVYIRSLARDIANMLGTVGYLSKLHRTTIGSYTLTNSELQVIPLRDALYWLPEIILNDTDLQRLRLGQRLRYEGANGLYKVVVNDICFGLGRVENYRLSNEKIAIEKILK